MKAIYKFQNIPYTIIALLILSTVVLLITPPEETLGNIVKLVFLHAALVQTGLLFFAAGAVFSLFFLILKKNRILPWIISIEEAAVLIWAVYFVSSMFATYFSWGVWIAWEEPRTIASIKVLILSVIFLAVVLWLKNQWISSGLNLLMGILAWFMTKSAITLRHPLNPIAHSNSGHFKFYFAVLFFLVLLMAIQLVRWRFAQNKNKPISESKNR